MAEGIERLHAQGRLSMSRDEANTEWRDVGFAVNTVRASLDVAIQAIAWRETSTGRSLDSCRAVSFRNRRHRDHALGRIRLV